MARFDLPPRPPAVVVSDDHPLRRVHFRLWQITVSAVTLLLTVWCFQLDLMLGLAVTFLTKHVLVAVLAAGLNLPEPRR